MDEVALRTNSTTTPSPSAMQKSSRTVCYHPGIWSHRRFQGRSLSGRWCRTLPQPAASSPESGTAVLCISYWETQLHSAREKSDIFQHQVCMDYTLPTKHFKRWTWISAPTKPGVFIASLRVKKTSKWTAWDHWTGLPRAVGAPHRNASHKQLFQP